MVFERRLPIYGVDEIPSHSDLLCYALSMRGGARRRRICVGWRRARPIRERFLALYEITQESCATRVAAQARRHLQTVMEWLHLYNTPEALAYQRTGPPFARRSRPALATCRPTFSLSPARSRCRSGAALRRLAGRAVRPDLLPRDDPCRPASSGI